ncbi:hypothetical protein GGD81_000862 [Rhodobium orientis]|nr:sulfotransferase family 2 domain-containing protein [Rhodobium orientis]MBB4301845.1 hypothetical protein [Rhodobium orientis]
MTQTHDTMQEETPVPKRERPGPLTRLLVRHAPQLVGRARLLDLRPKPLIDPEHRILVVWSPKSACTAATIWFFKVIGKYEEARAYNAWPHHYRRKVYYPSDLHRRGMVDDFSGYRVIRVIRDPGHRAVSSYRHALRTGYFNKRASHVLGRPVDETAGYSFREYLSAIGLKDLSPIMSNPHHGVQTHPIERLVPPTDVINVTRDDLFSRLNGIEADLGLERTDFGNLAWFHSSESGPRKRKVGVYEDDVTDERFDRRVAAQGPWPEVEKFLTPEIGDTIRRLYAVDYDRYGSYF